jgi:hypothetical protein
VASFGFTTLWGQWEFDERGRVVGFLTCPASVTDTTRRIDITAFWGSISSSGKSFVMTGQTEDGNVAFRGVPFATLTVFPPV